MSRESIYLSYSRKAPIALQEGQKTLIYRPSFPDKEGKVIEEGVASPTIDEETRPLLSVGRPVPRGLVVTPHMQRLPTYKVLVAGDGSVGKTSLLYRQTTGIFEPGRQMTVGVDFYTQVVTLGERRIKLTIWDIAGQTRFALLRRSFYRGTRAAALIFDVSDADTLHHLTLWRDEILKIAPDARMLVIGNKIDLPRQVSCLEGKAWATAMGYPYIETSARTGQGVDRLFEGLGWLAISDGKGHLK